MTIKLVGGAMHWRWSTGAEELTLGWHSTGKLTWKHHESEELERQQLTTMRFMLSEAEDGAEQSAERILGISCDLISYNIISRWRISDIDAVVLAAWSGISRTGAGGAERRQMGLEHALPFIAGAQWRLEVLLENR